MASLSSFFHTVFLLPCRLFFPFTGRTLVCVTSLDSSLWLIRGHCCALQHNPCKLSISTRGCGWLSACAGVTPNRRNVNGRADLEALRQPSCSSSTWLGILTSTATRIELRRPLFNIGIEHCASSSSLSTFLPRIPEKLDSMRLAPAFSPSIIFDNFKIV